MTYSEPLASLHPITPQRLNPLPSSVLLGRLQPPFLSQLLPLFHSKISAGFPSPADDHIEAKLDLNDLLIQHPAATFLVRVAGESMIGAGIYDGDILVVDKSLRPTPGKVVIAAIDGQLTVKRLIEKNKRYFLNAENNQYKPIEVTDLNDMVIWGVVTTVLHSL